MTPRLHVVLALLLAVPAGASAPDIAAPVLAADSEARWVPFTLTPGNQIRFDATLDGRPLAAILDTGASQSTLTRAYAERTGRRVGARGRIAAIGGAVPLGWTAVGDLAFGGLHRRGGGLNVVALPGAVTGNAAAIDLLVGRDLLDRFALDIDHANRRFRLLPSGRLPFTGARAPLRIGRAPLAYVTEVAIAGRTVRPVIVDTGDGSTLTIARAVWRTLPLAQQPAMTSQLAFGVGGSVIADIAVLPAVSVGARRFDDVSVWVERSGGFSDTARAAGRIGLGLLQRYRVLLDPAAGHMVLGDAGGGPAVPRSTSGLQVGLGGGQLRVLHVMRGSPAEADGWRTGDRICAVDGRTVADDPAAASADWPFGAPGRTVGFGMCDGATRTLTLRRFY